MQSATESSPNSAAGSFAVDRQVAAHGVALPRAMANHRVWNWLVVGVAIASNAGLLIAQQVSFRLLAPLIGSSIETWSTIIGVFLIGIAIGNRLAGCLADRFSSPKLVVASLAAGAVAMLTMPYLADTLASSSVFAGCSLTTQIITGATIVCLLPGIALSLALQPSLRSVVRSADEMGSASGNLFAWGTFGSLLGNYLAGFVLLALLGVRTIVWATGWSLLALAATTLIFGRGRVLGSGSSEDALKTSTPDSDQVTSATGNPRSTVRHCVSSRDAATVPSRWPLRAILVVAACSFASGALEGAAFRILAPLVGVSMFLSAGVIGVVLAGMSIGNYFGGRLASRYGSLQVLRDSLAICSVTTLLVAPLWKLALAAEWFGGFGLIPRVVVWSFMLFFLPSMSLGLITPQVIRLSIRDLKFAGTTSGRLYAWSTLGCVAGILVSAWFMIEALGAIRTSIICGLIPVVLIWLLAPTRDGLGDSKPVEASLASRQRNGKVIQLALMLIGAIVFFLGQSPYDRESKYFSLGVIGDVIDGREVKKLVLDRLVHSAIDLQDPGFLHYPHERVQGDFTRAAALEAHEAGRVLRVLVIGGGGYTFPRWVETRPDLNNVVIDVVEIDPAVTAIAHDELGLPHDTSINSFHMDGRQFVKSAAANAYDLVIQDAVNDYSVPYHLMTAEYNRLIRRVLRPQGVYMLTVIDSMGSGRFLASAIRTMRTTFPETNLLAPLETAGKQDRSVFVIAGRGPFLAGRSRLRWWDDRTEAHVFAAEEVDGLLARHGGRSPLLTDDFAPVDVLMTSQFLGAAE